MTKKILTRTAVGLLLLSLVGCESLGSILTDATLIANSKETLKNAPVVSCTPSEDKASCTMTVEDWKAQTEYLHKLTGILTALENTVLLLRERKLLSAVNPGGTPVITTAPLPATPVEVKENK